MSKGAPISANDPNYLPACAGCGRCCHQVVGLVAGVDRVPEEWVVEHDGLRCMEQRGDGACVALDPVTRLCTIYENRPSVCREFERGGELCRRILARPAKAQRRDALTVRVTPHGQPMADASAVVSTGD